MAHPTRFLLEGYCYHVVTVTRGRRPILRSWRNATIVADAIQYIRTRASVLAVVVMPDHFHVLIVPLANQSLPKIMQSVKGYTARVINTPRTTHRPVWQQSYYDRVIRDESQLQETIDYIHRNPVDAGLVDSANKYPLSSAFPGVATDLGEFLAG